jgi:hypothetical protein
MPEWTLRNVKTHYSIHENKAGLVRIKCRYCEYVVIAEKKLTLFALNLIHKHLIETHNIPIDQVSQ